MAASGLYQSVFCFITIVTTNYLVNGMKRIIHYFNSINKPYVFKAMKSVKEVSFEQNGISMKKVVLMY